MIKRLISTFMTTAVGLPLLVAAVMPLSASAATNATVYDNIPSPQPVNVPSVGYEATSTSEFGGQVGLAGSERLNPTVTVLMSSWACESGGWTSGCTTTPGTTFTHPITLNVYNVGSGNSVGSLITTKTQTFTMPYRPSSDSCGGDATAWTASDNSCNHGLAFTISFDLTGVTLPDNVIIGVAYNTSNYGANPIGTTGPYDSLNVGTAATPSVGTPLPSANDAYYNSSHGGFYCDGGAGGTGTFRLDAGCWTGNLPAFKVEASSPVVAHGEILKPKAGHHYTKTLKLKATYEDGDVPNNDDIVQWAVRKGTCAANTGTVYGNVDGHSDAYNWDGNTFKSKLDIRAADPGEYCFVFNPKDDAGQPDVRLTRTFYIDAYVPHSKKDCKKGGWQDYLNPAFRNQGQCIKYVEHHSDHHDNDEHHGHHDSHHESHHHHHHHWWEFWHRD